MKDPSKYIWDNIAHLNGNAKHTKQIERAVRDLFTEIGAISAPYNYPLPERDFGATKPFKGYICTSVNDVICHGLPDYKIIDWDKDVVNVDISFKWKGLYYDTCQSWGSQPISTVSADLTEQVSRYVKEKHNITTREIGEYTELYMKNNHPEYRIVTMYGGHGIGTEVHMPPFIPPLAALGQDKDLRQSLPSGATGITVEPIVFDYIKHLYAQTEIQLALR